MTRKMCRIQQWCNKSFVRNTNQQTNYACPPEKLELADFHPTRVAFSFLLIDTDEDNKRVINGIHKYKTTNKKV